MLLCREDDVRDILSINMPLKTGVGVFVKPCREMAVGR